MQFMLDFQWPKPKLSELTKSMLKNKQFNWKWNSRRFSWNYEEDREYIMIGLLGDISLVKCISFRNELPLYAVLLDEQRLMFDPVKVKAHSLSVAI